LSVAPNEKGEEGAGAASTLGAPPPKLKPPELLLVLAPPNANPLLTGACSAFCPNENALEGAASVFAPPNENALLALLSGLLC
jgi:hypothetical protein